MKKIFIPLLVMCAASLYADEIHLKDGSVIRGEVKGAGADTIIYRDEAVFHAKEVPLANAARIVYPEGLTVNPNEKVFDDVHRRDGSVFKAKVLRVTGDSVVLHGEREIVPRRVPTADLSKVVYNGGSVISFLEAHQAAIKAQSEGKAQASDKVQAPAHYPPPTHHVDGAMNFYLILLAGFGITRNADLAAYTEDQAQRYLTHLQSYDPYWSTSRVEGAGAPYHPDLDLEIEARLFDDIGIGIGVTGGLSLIMPATVNIVDASGNETVMFFGTGFFAYCATTLFLKHYFAIRNSMAVYVLGGAGIGLYYGNATISISEGDLPDAYGLPDKSSYEESFSGSGTGYHGVLELGIEQKPVTVMAGVKIRYADIDELESGGRVMRLDSGSAAHLKLNGAMLYAGIGLLL